MIKITVFQDGQSMGTGAYHTESVLVGRGKEADLQVEEEGVLDEHCEIVVIDHKLYVRPVEDAPVWVDGKQVGTAVLSSESQFRVGGNIEFRASYRRPSTSGRFERVGAVSFRNAPERNADPAPTDDSEPETPSAIAAPAPEPVPAPVVKLAQIAQGAQQQQRRAKFKLIAISACASVALTALLGFLLFSF